MSDAGQATVRAQNDRYLRISSNTKVTASESTPWEILAVFGLTKMGGEKLEQ